MNLKTKKAVVETDGTVTNKRLKEAIANVGFEMRILICNDDGIKAEGIKVAAHLIVELYSK